MEELTSRQSAVLDVLDEKIAELERKLEKVQPFINELNRLKQTRRVLLSEGGTTGGGGNNRAQLSQEMVINFMREQENGVEPQDIATHYGISGQIVRSHLNRGKDTRYALVDGKWYLTEQTADEEDE